MADSAFQILSDFFARYGYWVVFFGVMLENAGLPVPGETVLLFAGFLAYHGRLDLARAIVTAIVGATAGDSLGFLVGRYGGTALVDRYLKRWRFVANRFEGAQKLFLRYGQWAVFTARFITGLRVFAGVLAGLFLMPYPRFLVFNFTGAVCWAITIGYVGFLFGGSWERLVNFLKQLDRITLIAVLAGVVIVIAARAVRRRFWK